MYIGFFAGLIYTKAKLIQQAEEAASLPKPISMETRYTQVKGE
jgi:hypothetical protein